VFLKVNFIHESFFLVKFITALPKERLFHLLEDILKTRKITPAYFRSRPTRKLDLAQRIADGSPIDITISDIDKSFSHATQVGLLIRIPFYIKFDNPRS